MQGRKWQKIVGGAMVCMMSFSIIGTTLAVPVHAASYGPSWSERQHRNDVHKEMERHQRSKDQIEAQIREEEYRHNEKVRQLRQERERREQEQYERERRERWEREHNHGSSYDRYREARRRGEAAEAQRKHDKKVQTNRTIAAAGVGAIIGAVIAHNTKK